VLLAETLLDTAIYDVSPGSMYFRSLREYFATPRHGLPCLTTQEYGKRLRGAVVKYAREKEHAEEVLGTNVVVIPNGVPQAPLTRRPDRRIVVIGTAARISRDKRLEELIDAIRVAAPALPPYVVQIAGGIERDEEAYARELRRRARGLAIQWLGELTDLQPFFEGLDIFAMISEPAGCPNASLEAMAAGLPVVATDHGGASEQIIDGVTGRLLPRSDPRVFAEALIELAHNATLRRDYGKHAHEHVRRSFSIERMVHSYCELCFGGSRDPKRSVARACAISTTR